jgi:beta-glucosidase
MGAQQFRDLNRNGVLDPYEDPTAPLEVRVADLLSQMNLAEKAGMMSHAMTMVDTAMAEDAGMSADKYILTQSINHCNAVGGTSAREMATWHNQLQSWAESTRLGIPVTLSTDPRHSFTNNPGASMLAGDFSMWPEHIGLAAIRDPELVRQYAEIARQEYTAVGFRCSLNPMADIATEPRWGRINGTFGEDVEIVAAMTSAYIRGLQGDSLDSTSVACMVKHFPGGGPQMDGEDPHFPYGREQIYPADMFEHHLKPFEAAFAAGVAQVMPYYGMPHATDYEEVGFAFNRQIIADLLRGHYGFDGVVCADWGVLTDSHIFGKILPARAWGMEHLSVPERALSAINAGIDQFGGESCPEVIIELVESGAVSEDRIDESVRRMLRDKFKLGLFDNPYVDVELAEQIVGQTAFREAGDLAQRRSITVLKNNSLLPLSPNTSISLDGVEQTDSTTQGDDSNDAEIVIIRIAAPFEPRDSYPLENFFHQGSLAFDESQLAEILRKLAGKKSIVAIDLDRPAVIPEIVAAADAVIGIFGASDHALLDVIFGIVTPEGRLPFEMPSSMEAVRAQASDAPCDSEAPLFSIGHGLSY